MELQQNVKITEQKTAEKYSDTQRVIIDQKHYAQQIIISIPDSKYS